MTFKAWLKDKLDEEGYSRNDFDGWVLDWVRDAFLAGNAHGRKRRRETIAPFNLENMVEGLGRVAEANAHNPTAALTLLAVARLLDRLIEEGKA